MKKSNTLTINTNILSGEESFAQLAKYIDQYGIKSPAVIVDKNLYENSEYVSKNIKIFY